MLPAIGAELEVRTIPTPSPGPGEVLVRVAACGVCHTDLHVIRGEVAFPAPCVLGHEITGTVEALGAGVHGPAVGTEVAASFIMPCGYCRHCVRGWEDLCETFFQHNRLAGHLYDGSSRLADGDGAPIAMYSMAGLAEYSVVPATDVFPLPDTLNINDSAILGCSVFTSFGAVKNVAKVGVGDTVAVIAVGGIGLNIVQMSAVFGASTIIAVDVDAAKLDLAAELGATHTIDSSQVDPVAAIRDLTGGHGVDVVFEALGSKPTVETAIQLADDGGRVVLVGIAPAGVSADLPIAHLVRRKIQLLGSYGARARSDMPQVLALAAAGRIRLDPLITDRFDLDAAGTAYQRLGDRRIIGRAVVDVRPRGADVA